MDQTKEVLLVEIFQIGVVVLQGQVFGDFPVSTTKAELITAFGCAIDREIAPVRRRTADRFVQLTRGKGNVIQFLRGHDAACKRLRQQTTIVADQNRQVRGQRVTEFQFGFGEAHLCVGSDTGPVADGRAIGVGRNNGVSCVGIMVINAATQVQPDQGLCIKTETDGALSKAREVVEFQTGSGFTLVGSANAFTKIVVEIQSTRTNGRFAVFKETSCTGLLGQYTDGYGQGQGGLLH